MSNRQKERVSDILLSALMILMMLGALVSAFGRLAQQLGWL